MATLLAAVVLQAAWKVVGGQLRAADTATEAGERLDVARITRFLLGRELREGRFGRDWLPPSADSVALRAFRGVALPCGERGPGSGVRVRYRGVRRPEPAKDSVLLLRVDGRWEPAALESVRADEAEGCTDGGGWRVERWEVGIPVGAFVAARLFERGSYHLSGGALRYRSGGGGRQPLTPERLDDRASALEPGAGSGAVILRLGFLCRRGPCDDEAWRTTLRPTEP